MTTTFHVAILVTLFCSGASAAQLPVAAPHDPRIGLVDYRSEDITLIRVQRGTATRIVLANDEKILPDGAATGFPSDCSKPELEWCLRAEPGNNQVLVKPQDGATHNNLELRTDKRDYSFLFDVTADAFVSRSTTAHMASLTAIPLHRVIFRYPTVPITLNSAPPNATGTAVPSPQKMLQAARPKPKNWRYSMQVMAGSDDIIPALAFDDGRFTYFQFPANREMPTIYYVSAAGEEGRVNFHIDQQAPDIVVVERMSRRFMFRLGDAAIGIWNDAYDAFGKAPTHGTTVDGVARAMRKE